MFSANACLALKKDVASILWLIAYSSSYLKQQQQKKASKHWEFYLVFLRFGPGPQLSTHPAAFSSFRSWVRVRRAKARKCMAWDEAGLIREGDGKVWSFPQKTDAQTVLEQWLIWKDQILSFFFSAGYDVIWYGKPQSACSGMQGGKQKPLMLSKHCSVVAKTWMCNQRVVVIHPKHSTMWVAMKKVNSIPVRWALLSVLLP